MAVNYNVKLIKLREFLLNKFNCILNELEQNNLSTHIFIFLVQLSEIKFVAIAKDLKATFLLKLGKCYIMQEKPWPIIQFLLPVIIYSSSTNVLKIVSSN